MRVAIIAEVYLPKVDGVVIRTMNLIRDLRNRGDEVLVICPEVEGRRESPVPYVELPSFPFPDYPEYKIGTPDDRLTKAIEEFKPDVLHYINPFAFGFRAYDFIQQSTIDLPSVFSFHTLYAEYVKQYALLKPLSSVLWWLMRDYHNCADVNLTVSSIMKDDLADRGFERVHLWPPAVDSSLFSPDRATTEMRERLSDGNSDQPLLITVSRLAPEKNVGFLAKLLKKFPQARLAIIGDGPQRSELERKFRDTNTNFLGYLKGEQLATAYASADAFIYASETETLGNVLLEAMASGLPIVAPRAGGIPSFVTHGENGLLFTPKDLSDASGCLDRILNDERYRTQMGHSAHRAVREWSWQKGADKVREHYRTSIERAQNAPLEQTAQRTERSRRLAKCTIGSLVMAYRTMHWVKQAASFVSRKQSHAGPVHDLQGLELAGTTILESGGGKHGSAP